MECVRTDRAFNLPNLLTGVRIALLPAIVSRFRRGDLRGALVLYLLSMLTDAADGYLARRLGQITNLGKLLDPLADKLSLLTLLWLFAEREEIVQWAMALMLFKEAVLVAGSLLALNRGIVVSARPIGKMTTGVFVLSMTLRFLDVRFAADALLCLAVLLSYAALIRYAQSLYGQKHNTVSKK